jgi:DNA-binding transcriptional LysR family regulator
MEIRHVRSFVAAAESENFSQAALRLHLAQSALSRHIATLEDEVGCALFERTGRGVRLTPAGRAFLPEARRGVEAFDRLKESANGLSSGATDRVVRTGMLGSLAEVLLPRLLERLDQTDVRLHLIEGFSDELAEDVAGGRLDLAAVPLLQSDSRLVVESLTPEPMAVVGLDVGDGGPLSLVDALQMPLVLPSPDTLERRAWEQLAHRHDVALRAAGEADSYGMEVSLAKHGQGCVLVSRACARALATAHGLRWRLIDDMALETKLIRRARAGVDVETVGALIRDETRLLFGAGGVLTA